MHVCERCVRLWGCLEVTILPAIFCKIRFTRLQHRVAAITGLMSGSISQSKSREAPGPNQIVVQVKCAGHKQDGKVGTIDKQRYRDDMDRADLLVVTFISSAGSQHEPIEESADVAAGDLVFMNKAADETTWVFLFSSFFTVKLPGLLGVVLYFPPPYRAAAAIIAQATLPLVDTVTDLLVITELHETASPFFPAGLAILIFSSLSSGLFALWESFYGGEGNFSTNVAINALISLFFGVCGVRIQVLSIMLIWRVVYKKEDLASLRICDADPIDMGNSFVVLSLMMLLNVVTESTFELILQTYIAVSSFFAKGEMPDFMLCLSLAVGCLSFAATLASTFMHSSSSLVQGVAVTSILASLVARVSSICLLIYFAGTWAGFSAVGVSYLLSALYNVHFHFDWADKQDFGPGGKHEKLFHLFIDSQITFLCPFAYAGLATGNQMYDEGEVRSSFEGYIKGLPISFIKDNSRIEGNYASTRAFGFAIFRAVEVVAMAVGALVASHCSNTLDDCNDVVLQTLLFTITPMLVSLVLHAALVSRRRDIAAATNLLRHDRLAKSIVKLEKNEMKKWTGCSVCGIGCFGYGPPGDASSREDSTTRQAA